MKLNILSLILDYSYSAIKVDKWVVRKLMNESSSITEHLIRKLNNQKFFTCKRINFICKDSNITNKIRNVLGVLEMDVYFDCKYFDMDIQDKQKYIISVLLTGFEQLCHYEKWDFNIIKEILLDLSGNDFRSSFYTDLKCKNENYTAKLCAEQSLEKIDFYVEFYHKRNLIKNQFLFTSKPNVFDYDRYLGKLFWDNENEVVLLSKDGHSRFTAEFK